MFVGAENVPDRNRKEEWTTSFMSIFFVQILSLSRKSKQKIENVSELSRCACTVPILEVLMWSSTQESAHETDINVLTFCSVTHMTVYCCVHIHASISNIIQNRRQLKKVISYVV